MIHCVLTGTTDEEEEYTEQAKCCGYQQVIRKVKLNIF
jgi:hypothetical protein